MKRQPLLQKRAGQCQTYARALWKRYLAGLASGGVWGGWEGVIGCQGCQSALLVKGGDIQYHPTVKECGSDL